MIRLPAALFATALLAAALLAATPAAAASVDAFRSGDWATAMRDGRAENTADSLVIAGRAQLAVAGYQVSDKARALALIAAAERDFDTVLARDPRNSDAELQKAVAIAYRAQLTRGIGLAKDVRRRFEALRVAHPDNPVVWSALGGWHGGAIAAVGSFVAGSVLGAKRAEMERCYAQALKLAPNLPSTRVFFAITLMDLDTDNAARAAALLKGLDTLPAHDGFELLLKRAGLELAASLAKGDPDAAQATARRLKAFAKVS